MPEKVQIAESCVTFVIGRHPDRSPSNVACHIINLLIRKCVAQERASLCILNQRAVAAISGSIFHRNPDWTRSKATTRAYFHSRDGTSRKSDGTRIANASHIPNKILVAFIRRDGDVEVAASRIHASAESERARRRGGGRNKASCKTREKARELAAQLRTIKF